MSDGSATFLATIPPVLAGIRFSGDGDARIMLDVPESEIAQVTKLLLMRGKVLRVTVEPATCKAGVKLDEDGRTRR